MFTIISIFPGESKISNIPDKTNVERGGLNVYNEIIEMQNIKYTKSHIKKKGRVK